MMNQGFYYTNVTNRITFILPDGGNIVITPSTFSSTYGIYNTISVRLSPLMLLSGGGVFNNASAAANDLYGRDGVIYPVSNSNAFVQTWVVPDSENFFKTQIVVNSLPDGIAYMNCAGTRSIALPTSPAPSWNSYWFRGVQDVQGSLDLDDLIIASLEQDCATLFSTGLSACNAILPVQPYISKCLADALLVANAFDFGQNHLQDYLHDCYSAADSMQNSGQASLVNTGDDISNEQGFGNNTCPGNCSGNDHGTCGSSGCTCVSGFTGTDCSALAGGDLRKK